MFHSQDGLFFQRGDDDSVNIVVTHDGMFPAVDRSNVIFITSLPASSWASVVASMSIIGETYDTWNKAGIFHCGSTSWLEKKN